MTEQMMQNKAGEMAAKQTIPAGYKQTEVGIIPEDWEVNQLGDLCSLKSGLGITAKEIDDSSEYRCFGGNGLRGYTKKHTHEGDYALIGRQGALCGNVQYVSGKFFASEHALVASPTKSVNTRWLSIYLERMNLNQYSESSAQPGLSAEKLRILKLITPTSEEQATIAKVLSDTAVLITGLEELIAKKQSIKTATMQQLLTGRTRLPQFAQRPDGTPKGYKSSELGQIPEDWEALAIDDCATKVGSGKTPNGGASVYIDAGRPFVRSQNIGWGRLMLNDVAYISDDIHNTFSGSEIQDGDVLLNITGASIGRCTIAEESIVGGNVNQHVCIIRLNSFRLNARLLVELINSRDGQKQIDSYQAGGNREGLNFQQVRQLKFAVSNSAIEQKAIATILSDMDSELNELEQKLAKARDVKQGMMQQLLTGRIRLPQEVQA